MNHGTALQTEDGRTFYVTDTEHAGLGEVLEVGAKLTEVSAADGRRFELVAKAGDDVHEVVLIEDGAESDRENPAGQRVLMKEAKSNG